MVVIFLGPPGSGKGTQSDYLHKFKNFCHISTGDLLRLESNKDTELGKKLGKIMGSGSLVSDDIVNEIVGNYVSGLSHDIVLDGYPRTLSQAIFLQQFLKNYLVLHFDIDIEKLRDRVGNRFSCSNCKKIYNAISHPLEKQGICDDCGCTKFDLRKDDNAEALINRVQIYNHEIEAILDFYKNKGTIRTIDADLSKEEVSKQIEYFLNLYNQEKSKFLAAH
ncbi:MAG: nucleoside monophosphate kinase [Rickettsiaceae bacterium]|nr:nucleoside monophosphate kinase [Rickettsiaceae bacterium]